MPSTLSNEDYDKDVSDSNDETEMDVTDTTEEPVSPVAGPSNVKLAAAKTPSGIQQGDEHGMFERDISYYVDKTIIPISDEQKYWLLKNQTKLPAVAEGLLQQDISNLSSDKKKLWHSKRVGMTNTPGLLIQT